MFLPDILDILGRTPREFGALHIHVEPVTVAEERGAAVVWLQAAFSTATPGSLTGVGISATGDPLAVDLALPLPDLSDGRVVRWSLPLRFPIRPQELMFKVGASAGPGAERIRQAWKLTDTVEQPKEERRIPVGDASGFGLRLGAGLGLGLATGLFVLPIPSLGSVRTGGGAIRRHTAQEGPAGFITAVVNGPPPPLGEPEMVTVWAPGQPVPDELAPVRAAPQAATATPAAATRRCQDCFEMVNEAAAEKARACPNCSAPWY